MNKPNILQQKLAKSLDQANKREKKGPAAVIVDERGKKCKKIAISLFHTDLDRLDGIRLFMQNHGQHINASLAIKLALRTAPLSEALLAAAADVQAEDGRTRKE